MSAMCMSHLRAMVFVRLSQLPLPVRQAGFAFVTLNGGDHDQTAQQTRCSEPGDIALVDNRRSVAPGR